jgi:hypothetical protein
MEGNHDLQKLTKTLLYNGRCEHCRSVKSKMFKCSRCLVTRYCSPECQKNHWPEHKSDCSPRNIDDPEVKLSKISPGAVISYAAMYYCDNKVDPERYPILEINIPNDDFFDLLAGKIESLDHESYPIMAARTSVKIDKSNKLKHLAFVRLNYGGKTRTACLPIEGLKKVMEIDSSLNPAKYKDTIKHAINNFKD